MTATLPYSHDKLPDAASHVRLLRIEPAEWDNPIRVSIGAYNLIPALCPPFCAISYTWGPTKPAEYIHIDVDRNFAVRPNCAYALRQYRLHYSNKLVWIDSICIAQGDKDERSKQVQLMGVIFSQADFVVACLGPHQDDSEFLVPAIKSRSYYADNDGEMKRLGKAYAAFGSRQYWNRLWIVQEIRLAQEVYILCGKDVVCTWNELFLWNARCRVEFQPWRVCTTRLQRLLPLNVDPMDQSLFANVMRYKDSECTEIRDHVFGLIGISCKYAECAPPATLRVNYEGSLLLVITHVLEVSGHRLDTIADLRRSVTDLVDVLRAHRKDLTSLLAPTVRDDFSFVVKWPRSVYTERSAPAVVDDIHGELGLRFPEWSYQCSQDLVSVPLDVDEYGRLTTSLNLSFEPCKSTGNGSPLRSISQISGRSNTHFRKVHWNHQIVAFICGEVEPGDVLVVPREFSSVTYLGHYLSSSSPYALVIRRYHSQVFRMTGVGIFDKRLIPRDYGAPHRTHRHHAVFAVRKDNAIQCFANSQAKNQSSQDVQFCEVRNVVAPSLDAHQISSHGTYPSRYENFYNFAKHNPVLQMPIEDTFCTEFMKCVVASSPVSGFVYFCCAPFREQKGSGLQESLKPSERWLKKAQDQLLWRQREEEQEKLRERNREDYYEQERQKHENRLQRARELSGVFLLL